METKDHIQTGLTTKVRKGVADARVLAGNNQEGHLKRKEFDTPDLHEGKKSIKRGKKSVMEGKRRHT